MYKLNFFFWEAMEDYCTKGSTLFRFFFPLPQSIQILYGLTSHFDFLSTIVYFSLTENKSPEEVIFKMAWTCFIQQIQCNQQALIFKVEGLFYNSMPSLINSTDTAQYYLL